MCAIVTLSLRRTIFWDIRLQKCRDLENRVKGPSRSLIFHRAEMTSYWRSIVLWFCLMFFFWDIQCRKMSSRWNRGQRSLKVFGIDTYRSATYVFLLMFHSNHGPMSHRFRDRRQFQTKIDKFSHPRVFYARTDGVTLGWVSEWVDSEGHFSTYKAIQCHLRCIWQIKVIEEQVINAN